MLISSFKNYQLTEDQFRLVELLDEFISNNEFCFILKGYAGTGKTFMMCGLTDYLTSIKRPFAIAAPTGRAAKVISQKTKQRAYTIHKIIYSNTELQEYKVQDEDGAETFNPSLPLKSPKFFKNNIEKILWGTTFTNFNIRFNIFNYLARTNIEKSGILRLYC
jgi:tRNA(Met) C34 N-acetyltransferase TmcA